MQSVSRVTAVLDALAAAEHPLSVLEISTASGLDRAVVNRLTRALTDEGFVERERSGRYQMGPRAMVYANAYIDVLAVRRVGLPYAVELRERIGLDAPIVVSLNMRVGAEMTVIDAVWDSKVGLDSVLQVGTRFPIEQSATGRCVLAYLPPDVQRRLCGPAMTPELEARLDTVRKADGIDTTHGDVRKGIVGLGAAIFDEDHQPIAALALYGPDGGENGLPARLSELAVSLRRTADAIGFATGRGRVKPASGI